MQLTFDVTKFRLSFPVFASPTAYPDVMLEGYFEDATVYISTDNCGPLRDNARLRALNLMTAHLAQLFTQINAGQTPGIVQSSAVDKVSVSMVPPPVQNQLKFWLNLTPYGSQLAALLHIKAAGGVYVGGRPETSAFRRAGGF